MDLRQDVCDRLEALEAHVPGEIEVVYERAAFSHVGRVLVLGADDPALGLGDLGYHRAHRAYEGLDVLDRRDAPKQTQDRRGERRIGAWRA
nr:hypothetical protein [Acidiferrobacter sp. SPIII_3]